MPRPVNKMDSIWVEPISGHGKKTYIGIGCDFDRTLIEKDFVELVEPILTLCKVGYIDEAYFRPW